MPEYLFLKTHFKGWLLPPKNTISYNRHLIKKAYRFNPKALQIILPMSFPWMGVYVVPTVQNSNSFMDDLRRASELEIDLENPLQYLQG